MLTIVEAAAKPFASIDQMIMLNGAEGMTQALAAAITQGVTGLSLARNLLSGGSNAQANVHAKPDGDGSIKETLARLPKVEPATDTE